jgi:hypothetical protein
MPGRPHDARLDRPLGLIAGEGALPREIARAAGAAGRDVVAVAFHALSDPDLAADVARIVWLSPGEVGEALAFLGGAGVREAVLAGKVPKAALLSGGLRLDERARRLLAGLPDLRDATLLSALAGAIEAEGIALRPQAELVPELLAPVGPLGRVRPSQAEWRDVGFGWPIAGAVAALDIGQTVVVQDRAILAVEAIEGTDEAIRRAGRLGRARLCIVKRARVDCDPRFDLPAIGRATLEASAGAGAGVVAVEAGRTLVLDRPALIRIADTAGIAVVGVPTEGPGPADHGRDDHPDDGEAD